MYIFISHSSKEGETARKLCQVIEGSGHKCFLAPRDIRSGYEYAEEIANGIDHADAILLLLSKASNNSPHVLREVERGVSKSVPILVYQLEEVELTKSMEYFLMTHQWMEAGRDSYKDVVECINGMGNVAQAPADTTVEVKKAEKGHRHALTLALVVIVCLVLVVIVLMAKLIGADEEQTGGPGSEGSIVETSSPKPEVKLGDTLVMGNYNGEDIFWRVLKISEDGTEAIIVARDVLTVKAYDAPESGKFNHDGEVNYYFSDAQEILESDVALQAYVQGNSNWESSAVRTWLNSAQENVKYEGQAPTAAAMPEGPNAYHAEKGFLCSFTEEELAKIKTTEVVTKGNVLAASESIKTQDKVFLLSMDELEWFTEADVSLLAVPTEGAIANDGTYWYQDYCLGFGVEHTMWWLREPVADLGSQCYLVGNGYHQENIYTSPVGVECYGIRPAMTIDLTAEKGYDIIR